MQPPARILSTAEARREEVIAAARHVVAARGYHGTPTTAIAKAAGISQAYLFRLFPTKLELFLALTDDCFDRVSQTFTDAARRARAAGEDPLAFRLRHLRDGRMRAVLEAAAEAFGWQTFRAGEGRGRGIAAGTEKGSYVATCAEVAVDADGAVRVTRVVQAFECGAIVNPAGLRSQVEGALVQGLGGALFEAVRFENGRILTDGFRSYRVPRFGDMPAVEIVLLDRKDLASAGGSETPIIGIAPAIGNAIFDATGRRLRSLPLLPGS